MASPIKRRYTQKRFIVNWEVRRGKQYYQPDTKKQTLQVDTLNLYIKKGQGSTKIYRVKRRQKNSHNHTPIDQFTQDVPY
jgi:hypothetical protein